MSTPIAASSIEIPGLAYVLANPIPADADAVGYIRKSKEIPGKNIRSYAQQDGWIREQARVDGIVGEVKIFTDRGRSGRKRVDLRKEYAELLEWLETPTGRPKVFYTWRIDRVHRKARLSLELFDYLEDNGITLRASDDTGDKLTRLILAGVAEREGDMAAERATAIIRLRQSLGEKMGAGYGWMVNPDDRTKLMPHPTEDLGAVIEAFRQAGTINGAAKLLNAEARVLPRHGGKWRANSVMTILRREVPDLLPARHEPRVKSTAPYYLFRLLECHCGKRLTASREGTTRVRYKCIAAISDPDHAKPSSVMEVALLPWVKAHARWDQPGDRLKAAAETAAARADVEDDMRRADVMYGKKRMTDDEYEAALAAGQRELARLENVARAHRIADEIRWDSDPVLEVNAALRALWDRVELGPDLRPVRAHWNDPELQPVEPVLARSAA